MDDIERRILNRARKGDLAAFEEVVTRYQRRVYAVAFRVLRRHDLADDVTQETFVRAHQALGSYDPERPFGPWVCRIAVNLALNQVRSPRFREQALPEGHAETPADAASPLDRLLEEEAHERLESALETLPVEQRATFVLRVSEEMSYQEIAAAMECSVGTVMSRLSRARHKLRAALRPYLGVRAEEAR